MARDQLGKSYLCMRSIIHQRGIVCFISCPY